MVHFVSILFWIGVLTLKKIYNLKQHINSSCNCTWYQEAWLLTPQIKRENYLDYWKSMEQCLSTCFNGEGPWLTVHFEYHKKINMSPSENKNMALQSRCNKSQSRVHACSQNNLLRPPSSHPPQVFQCPSLVTRHILLSQHTSSVRSLDHPPLWASWG